MNVSFISEIAARLLAVQAIIHAIEFLMISKSTSATGVWRWRDLEKEFGSPDSWFVRVLRLFLADRNFDRTNIFRIAVAVWQLVVPSAVGAAFLFAIQLLTMLRWLGTFNGGSDYMALLVSFFTMLALALPPSAAKFCLWYIAAQLCLSYVRAGWVKIVSRDWRNGVALSVFISSPMYAMNRFTTFVSTRPIAQLIAWAVMFFELTFPLSLLNPQYATGYMAVGLLFHLGNAFVFGLNRFVYAWLAAYPALYFCSLNVNLSL